MKNSLALLRSGLLGLFALVSLLFADGPADNIPENVRRVPPLGIEVSQTDHADLQARLQELESLLDELEKKLKPPLKRLIPDVEVFHRAVYQALNYQEFQQAGELKLAGAQLDLGKKRARHLLAGEAPWLKQTGLVVRGFRSRLDDTVQPYGLVIPPSYQFDGAHRHRLDFWFHGRGEKMNEVGFIQGRLKSPGQFTPADTIMLHPYARYSNANKFAGEIDCLEALEHVKEDYRVDENRILVRGFSMGGAACWQFAVHYADRWCAANPGAGFSETPDFLKTFQGETLNPTWYEKRLWHWYDCTDYAINFFNLPTVAYSGEIDRQKQAADMMDVALAKEGMQLTHIIGPGMGHKIDPVSQEEIARRLDAIAAHGRDPVPAKVKLTTWTLRYPSMFWVQLDRLGTHWERARLDAELTSDGVVISQLENVEAFSLVFYSGACPLDNTRPPTIVLGNQRLSGPPIASDRSWTVHLRKQGEAWAVVESPRGPGLEKRHGLSGPIDDAFMDRFLFVQPSGSVDAWTTTELDHAVTHWRQQFRGDVRQVKDTE
ncbi:MAG: hypothetical protein ACI97B_002874, partial [Verrucomicrobiales bacterium]